jgi:hypothetical protein
MALAEKEKEKSMGIIFEPWSGTTRTLEESHILVQVHMPELLGNDFRFELRTSEKEGVLHAVRLVAIDPTVVTIAKGFIVSMMTLHDDTVDLS